MATVSEVKMHEHILVRNDALRFIIGIAFSALSGIMLLLAFPPYGYWMLAWIGFVPGIFAQHRLFSLKWSSLGPAITILFWLGPFLARLFGTEYGPVFTYLGVIIALLVFFVQTERKFHELTHYRWFVLQGVINWVGFELIRATFIPLIATTAFIGYTQATQSWLIQPVSIFSIYGLNLMVMLVNYTLALGIMAYFDSRWHPKGVIPVHMRSSRHWLAITGTLLVVWVGLSLFILSRTPQDSPVVRVAVLQPNFPQPAFLDEQNTSEMRLERISEQAREAAEQGAQILYTPEMIFNFDPQVEYTEELRTLTKETGAFMFITYTVVKEGQDFRNEAVLLSPTGDFSLIYGKNHAFGEPLTPVRGIYPVFDTPLGQLATMICHDGNYTDVARKLARNGAQLTAAPIREFGRFGEQYWTNVLFRAVENHTAMVVAGVANVSAIINPDGKLVALELDPDGAQVTLVGDVNLGTSDAFYSSVGDWVGWLVLVGLVVMMIFQVATGRRAKKAS